MVNVKEKIFEEICLQLRVSYRFSKRFNSLNSVFNIHTNAVFMPYVLTFNRSAIENKIAKLSEYLELKEASFNSFLTGFRFREKIKIPHKLSDCAKITDKDIEKLI